MASQRRRRGRRDREIKERHLNSQTAVLLAESLCDPLALPGD